MNRSREKLLKEIQELDFRAYDLRLYLDTHPHDAEAVKEYNAAMKKSNAMTAHFEKLYGPITMRREDYTTPWAWIEGPWPWQNYRDDNKEVKK
jgi:spore coat protein JB